MFIAGSLHPKGSLEELTRDKTNLRSAALRVQSMVCEPLWIE